MGPDGTVLARLRGEGALRLPAMPGGLRLIRVTGASGSRVFKMAMP